MTRYLPRSRTRYSSGTPASGTCPPASPARAFGSLVLRSWFAGLLNRQMFRRSLAARRAFGHLVGRCDPTP